MSQQNGGKFVPYAYISNNKNQAYSSNDTYGLRFTGESPEYSNGMSAFYTAEYASQKGAHNNTSTAKFKFMNFELGAKNKMFSALVGYEFLGGNGTSSFVTPYSTIHKFNGWADLFINQNPASSNVNNGLKDTYIGLTANMYDMNATARYHDFRADNVNMHYGNELDLSLSKNINKNVSVLAKFADYRKKDSNVANTTINTKKFWLQIHYSLLTTHYSLLTTHYSLQHMHMPSLIGIFFLKNIIKIFTTLIMSFQSLILFADLAH